MLSILLVCARLRSDEKSFQMPLPREAGIRELMFSSSSYSRDARALNRDASKADDKFKLIAAALRASRKGLTS
jgi:hypothetical protein